MPVSREVEFNVWKAELLELFPRLLSKQ